jgi:hypothetical protein
LILRCAARRKGASRSWGCDSKPFCYTWLLEPTRSCVMDRSKTRLAAAKPSYWMSHPSGTPAVSPNPSPTARRRGDPQPPLGPSGQPVVRDGQVEDQALVFDLRGGSVTLLAWSRRWLRISTSPRRWPALAVTLCCVRTVCPAVRNRGPRTDTIQSCALVAPE